MAGMIIHALFSEAIQAQLTRNHLAETYSELTLSLEILEDKTGKESGWMTLNHSVLAPVYGYVLPGQPLLNLRQLI